MMWRVKLALHICTQLAPYSSYRTVIVSIVGVYGNSPCSGLPLMFLPPITDVDTAVAVNVRCVAYVSVYRNVVCQMKVIDVRQLMSEVSYMV